MPVQQTKITWTDYSANHWVGCAKVSEGCQNCWAAGMADRFDRTPEPWTVANVEQNLQSYDEDFAAEIGSVPPGWMFVPSSSDPFIPWLPERARQEWLDALFANPQHCYQVLTKWGPEADRADQDATPDEYEPRQTAPDLPENAMLGVSVESPRRRYRLDWLREQDAEMTFVSFEPLVERVTEVDLSGIDWIIVGGESLQDADQRRDMDPAWAVDLYEAAREQDVAYLFKQHSGRYAEGDRDLDVGDGEPRTFDEFPETPDRLPEAPKEHRGGSP